MYHRCVKWFYNVVDPLEILSGMKIRNYENLVSLEIKLT